MRFLRALAHEGIILLLCLAFVAMGLAAFFVPRWGYILDQIGTGNFNP